MFNSMGGDDSPLKASIADLGIHRRLSQAQNRVSKQALSFALLSDVDPEDVETFKLATSEFGLIVIIRCPKRGAVAWHGSFAAKTCADGHDSNDNLVKSGLSGLGVHPERGNIFISDYDMMSMWCRVQGSGYRKVPAKDIDDKGEANYYATWMTRRPHRLRSPLQHGAQDDFVPPPGKPHMNVAKDCRCAAFKEGEAFYLQDRDATRSFYIRNGLKPWPYDQNGIYIRPEDRDRYDPWGTKI